MLLLSFLDELFSKSHTFLCVSIFSSVQFGTDYTFDKVRNQWRFHHRKLKTYTDNQTSTGRGRIPRPLHYDKLMLITNDDHSVVPANIIESSLAPRNPGLTEEVQMQDEGPLDDDELPDVNFPTPEPALLPDSHIISDANPFPSTSASSSISLPKSPLSRPHLTRYGGSSTSTVLTSTRAFSDNSLRNSNLSATLASQSGSRIRGTDAQQRLPHPSNYHLNASASRVLPTIQRPRITTLGLQVRSSLQRPSLATLSRPSSSLVHTVSMQRPICHPSPSSGRHPQVSTPTRPIASRLSSTPSGSSNPTRPIIHLTRPAALQPSSPSVRPLSSNIMVPSGVSTPTRPTALQPSSSAARPSAAVRTSTVSIPTCIPPYQPASTVTLAPSLPTTIQPSSIDAPTQEPTRRGRHPRSQRVRPRTQRSHFEDLVNRLDTRNYELLQIMERYVVDHERRTAALCTIAESVAARRNH